MKIFAETERLILREIVPADESAMFELDSDPEVHRYLGNKTVKGIDESRAMIQSIRQQYVDNGIGRWAVIEKATGEFAGRTGLKLIKEPTNGHVDFHDVGYRLLKRHWGKGYATESAKASLQYGFVEMGLSEIYGIVNIENKASRNALEKCGLKFIETFVWKGWNELPCDWLKITKEDWMKQTKMKQWN